MLVFGVYMAWKGVGFSSNLRETWVILWEKMSCFWLLENFKTNLFFPEIFVVRRDFFFFQPAERPSQDMGLACGI